MDFFSRIVTVANMGVVTAADFVPFVGRQNWLSFDRGEPLGNCDAYSDRAILSGVVYSFTLIDANVVENMCGIKIEGEGVLWMDADELAIRMEES